MSPLHRLLMDFLLPLCMFKDKAAHEMLIILLRQLDQAGYKIVPKDGNH